MSQRNPVEALEARTLLSMTPLEWPLQGAGITRIGRTLYIVGTDAGDQIRIEAPPTAVAAANKKIQVFLTGFRVNSDVPRLLARGIKRVLINGNGGDDDIQFGATITKAFRPSLVIIHGGAGKDTIITGAYNERIFGGSGDDTINAGAGVDEIDGGDGNDTITGGPGRDRIFGGLGDDTIRTLEPNDQRPEPGPISPRDTVSGGLGTDNAQADPADFFWDDVENKNA